MLYLVRTLRELGIDVPITNCNRQPSPLPGTLTTLNTDNPKAAIAEHRAKAPGYPAFISEFWIGGLDFWGYPYVEAAPPDWVSQRTMEALANRGMYNCYMFHGGTNFGFWAGNSVRSDHSWITTRYHHAAPIAEGGALNDKYFVIKAACLLGNNFADFFCSAQSVSNPLHAEGPVNLTTLAGPQGKILFVSPRQPVRAEMVWRSDGKTPFQTLVEDQVGEEIAAQSGYIGLRSGELLELAENSTVPMTLLYDFQLDEQNRVDFCNGTILGSVGPPECRTLLIRGEGGRKGAISVNGQRRSFVFPLDDILRIDIGSLSVLAVSTPVADRTWFADGRLIIGPAFVGASRRSQHECWMHGGTQRIYTVSVDGQHRQTQVQNAPTPSGKIGLANWSSRVIPEVDAGDLGWRDIGRPRSIEGLGGYYGYSWYRASYFSHHVRKSALLFTQAADRIHIFLNKRRLAQIWGRGDGATRDSVEVDLAAGSNEFVFFCDNMGRTAEGDGHDRKGIWNEVYVDANEHQLTQVTWEDAAAPPRASTWRFRTYRTWYEGSILPCFFRMRATVAIPENCGAVLDLRWIPQYAWIHANGDLVSEHGGEVCLTGGNSFGRFVLDPFIRGKQLSLSVTFYGELSHDLVSRIHLLTYPKSAVLGRWQFKAFEHPTITGEPLRTGPAWWECTFPKPDIVGPLFLVTEGLTKGYVLLNGRPAGRYWEVGPQHTIYLPEPWFRDLNVLAILDEHGRRPDHVYLVRDQRCPTQMTLA